MTNRSILFLSRHERVLTPLAEYVPAWKWDKLFGATQRAFCHMQFIIVEIYQNFAVIALNERWAYLR